MLGSVYVVVLLVLVGAYLLGSVNMSIILSAFMGGDIRAEGSGNAGATNMLRTYGKKMGALTFLFDFAKGLGAVLIAKWIFSVIISSKIGFNMSIISTTEYQTPLLVLSSLKYIAGIAVILGHNFPIYFGFKGGKGVATSAGVVIAMNPIIGLIVLALAIGIMAITKYVSLGSVLAPFIYLIIVIGWMYINKGMDIIYILFIVTLGILIIVKHMPNIKRLLNGTESKLGQKKKEKDV